MPSLAAYDTVTASSAAGIKLTVNVTAFPSVADASDIVSVGSPTVPVASSEAAPSAGAPVLVAMTRTVYVGAVE